MVGNCLGRLGHLLIAFGLLASLPSCDGDSLNTVHGQVLYKGEPAVGAVVVFHPKQDKGLETIRPTGVAGEDGSFTLSSAHAEGAPAGEYVVTITWPEEPKPDDAKGKRRISTEQPDLPPDRFRGKYAQPEKSSLTARIESGTNQLDPFRLE